LGSRIVVIPEQLQNVFEGYLRRIIVNLDSFSMITKAAIGWVLSASTGIADPGAVYSFNLPEPGIRTPESAHA
jgi:hypothetical protein